jgi:hypothetical protein
MTATYAKAFIRFGNFAININPYTHTSFFLEVFFFIYKMIYIFELILRTKLEPFQYDKRAILPEHFTNDDNWLPAI